jgi:long-chain acyl-CoA synthetase
MTPSACRTGWRKKGAVENIRFEPDLKGRTSREYGERQFYRPAVLDSGIVNVSAILARSAERVPDKPALLYGGQTTTYGELEDRVRVAASAFEAAGVAGGERVGLMMGNVPEFAVALYGAFRAGAVAVPLNVMLTSEEIGYILSDAGARAIVVEMQHLPTVLQVRDELPDLETVFVVGGPPAPAGTISFEQAMSDASPQAATDRRDADLAVLQYTSGTTGNPKGAMLTHENLVANLDQMDGVERIKIEEHDVVLAVLPLFHIYALNVVLGTALRAGATIALVERFQPRETLDVIRDRGVTILPGAPPMFAAWQAFPEASPDAFASVRAAISGAAPLPAEVLDGFQGRFGITIWEGYGLTEAAPAVTSNAMGSRAVGASIGIPLPGLEVRLVDEHGRDVDEEDDPGEIVVRGPNVFRGYWGREDESREAFLDGEWLRTGDVAVRDEDGYLYIVDRKKDLIIVSGFNVYPKEVEDVLARHPAVAETAVVGVPDQRTGEAVKAFVVLERGASATTEEIADHAARYLARFKVPKEIEVVESLPKHATGKVLRRALRGEEILGGDHPAAPTP